MSKVYNILNLSLTILIIFIVTSTKSQQQFLYPEDVAEGKCIYPNTVSLSIPQFMRSITYQHPLYVPMASKHCYRSYAKYFLGRPPVNQAEIDSMDLRIRYQIGTNTFRNSGYKRAFYQFCIPFGSLFRVFCMAGFGSPNTNVDPVRTTVDSLVWTNSENTAFLIVRCVQGRENDWKVVSKTPGLDSFTKTIVLNKIVELGYNISNVAYAKY